MADSGDQATRTSAPGKLFLFGEYGVLAGGWSIVAAVGRRVVAERRAEPSGYRVDGADLDADTALPAAVLATLGRTDLSPAHLGTDVAAFYQAGAKLGLGSSAASTVALTAACLDDAPGRLDRPERLSLFSQAFAAHRAFQSGRGSGADVAASALGGVIGYRLADPPITLDAADAVAPGDAGATALPEARIVADLALGDPSDDLRIEAIWLGEPARSTSFVRRLTDALAGRPAGVGAALGETATIAAAALTAIRTADTNALLGLVTRADAALERLGEAIGAPIATDAHRRLRSTARAHGLAAKPSGAGGGDFSLVLGPPDADWPALLADLPAGCTHVPLRLGADGVRVE